MWQLVAMNVLLLVLDITLLVMGYLDLYMIQTTFKSLLYSIKLKVEFAVLSQIVRVIQARSKPRASAFAITNDVEQQRMNNKALSSVVSEVEVLQRNVTPEWRLSAGSSAIVSPFALRMERKELEAAGSS